MRGSGVQVTVAAPFLFLLDGEITLLGTKIPISCARLILGRRTPRRAVSIKTIADENVVEKIPFTSPDR